MENDKDTDRIVSSLKDFFQSKEFVSLLNWLPESTLSTLFDPLTNITIEGSFEAYNKAIEEVKRDKRKTPLARREKLKKLLIPIDALNKALAIDTAFTIGSSIRENPARLTLPDGTSLFPFVPLTVNLNSDLDVSKLTYDENSYRIPYVRNQENGSCVACGEAQLSERLNTEEIWHKRVLVKKEELEVIPVSGRAVKVKVEKTVVEEGSHSLWDLYEWWLPSLDSEKLKNNDLLDQILVVYTIKRALNGDAKAVDALYNAYEEAAIGIACKMAVKRGLGQYLEDLKQNAKILLRLAISGFSPEALFRSLLKTEKSKALPIPKWIESFYIWYYSEYVPEAIEGHMKKLENHEEMHPMLEAFFIPTILDPYTSIKDKNGWVVSGGTRLNTFNSFSFRPDKNTNLTVWLFGTLKNPMQGRFRQLVSEQLDAYHKACKIETLETDISSRSGDGGEEDCHMDAIEYPSAQERHETTELDIENTNRVEVVHKQLRQLVTEQKISERNAEIFWRNAYGVYSKVDLAEEYSLSRMTIHRICKQVIEIIKENKFL